MSSEIKTPMTHIFGSSRGNPFRTITPTTAEAKTEEYIYEDVVAKPPFSPITVILDSTDPNMITYTITFDAFQGIIPPTIIITRTPAGVTKDKSDEFNVLVHLVSGPAAIRVTVTLGFLQNVDPLLYNDGDNYEIYLRSDLTVIADRAKGSQFITGPAASIGALGGPGGGGGFDPDIIGQIDPSQPVRVPIIDIYGQTTLNGEYLSDMTFVIQDQYKYCKSKNIIDPCQCECDILYIQPNKLKKTTLVKNNIPLEDVVVGKGNLYDKVFRIFNTTGELNFKFFNERFVRYAMLKYVLIRLLYGEYDLNKLCRNFNKQFFKDLKHSRFCGFIEFFENPDNEIIGFDQYFIKCDQC